MRAVCLACGASKWGALTACEECGERPATIRDQARSLLASDDHLDEPALVALSDQVRADGAVEMDEDLLLELSAELERVPAPPLGFVVLVVGLPFVGLALLGLLAIALLAG